MLQSKSHSKEGHLISDAHVSDVHFLVTFRPATTTSPKKKMTTTTRREVAVVVDTVVADIDVAIVDK